MPSPRPLTIDLEGQRVKVYRNLNLKEKLFSVQHKGIVVAHLAQVQLLEVQFYVNEAGRQRVLATRNRNVHAYAIGRFTGAKLAQAVVPISYNPYEADHFYRLSDQRPVHTAQQVCLLDGKTFVSIQEAESQTALVFG